MARSGACVALFSPWVPIHVIAVGLPETRLIRITQAEAAPPLGALPEVQVRHQQPRGAAVLGLKWPAVIAECHPRLAAGDVLEWQVRGVAAVTERHDVRGILPGLVQQRVHRYAPP